MNTYTFIGLASLLLAAALIVFNLIFSKRQKNVLTPLNKGTGNGLRIYIFLYRNICRIPLLRDLLRGIRKRLEIYTVTDEKTLRKRSVLLLTTTVLAFIILILLFWLITKDLLMLTLFTVLLAFIGDTIIEIFINKLQNDLLQQQLRYLELLRHKYYEHKSVEVANMEACDQLNQKRTFEVYTQAERINDILSSRNIEEELEKYYETAPNKYFKMLAGIIYITKEYGDSLIGESSVFVRCVSYLGNEIKTELHKREKLKHALKSLNIIALVPLFCLKPLRNWAANSFAPLEDFYTSKLGIILGVITVLSSVFSYIILRRLQRFDRPLKPGYIKPLEQRIYDAFLYRVVDRLVPKPHTQKGNSMTNLIKSAMAPLNIYTLYTRRAIAGFAAFFLGLLLFIGINAYSNHAVLYNPKMPEGFLGGKLSEKELNKLQEIADFDRSIILSLGKHPDDESIINAINEKGGIDNQETQTALERIKGKLNSLSNNILWYWQVILCFIFFIVGYNAPVTGLKIMAYARKIDMEDEVSQFQTIILMLMHMNRVHVQEILEWIETFSIHFKEPLQKCLLNFSAGPHEALEELKDEVNFPPFLRLIDNLQLACSDIEVSKAFEELENEISFNINSRKESNERTIERKRNLGSTLGFTPVYSLIMFYLIIPMIVSGMESLSLFYKQLTMM
ncbi:MAG: hypothetical protein ACOYEI_00745 [Acetivibrionales bacterium]|jgi:hypothetical protein|nr:hypothetical protein [Clostridiaceae bacterium]